MLPRELVEPFVLVLAPLAPHIAEELWERLGHTESLAYAPWPQADERHLRDHTIEVPVQVNGRMRGRISIPADATQAQALDIAQDDENVARHLAGKQLKRSIYVPGRIINFVVSS